MTSISEKTTDKAQTLPLRNASAADLEKISQDGLLSLSLEEMKTIQAYFEKLGRDPTDVELETVAQTWSEHCVHKTFKGQYQYEEQNPNGPTPLLPKTYRNLLKETIVRVTEELDVPWCLSVFKDNAGVIDFDESDGIAFKVETHNHPSALEPYGGAGTGIGGVIRDILGCGLGGKPVMNTDVFCFGPLDTPSDQLPAGALHPKRISQGVISGVRDYGNRMGIPTANGAVTFDAGYVGNPLVFCGTVGLIPKKAIQKSVQPGDLVVAVGGRTGRDGIHGATFSSAPLESGLTSNVVQIGHAIMEKKVMDVLLVARDKDLYRSVTDCGAGGFSSAIGELGQPTGVRVDLDKAPLKYPGLAPWEIWLSESQERMVFAVPPEHWNTFRILFEQEDVEAVVLGEFTNDKRLTVRYNGSILVELDMAFLHDGVPKINLNAVWDASAYQKKHKALSIEPGSDAESIESLMTRLLTHPIIASKEAVVRQYDHEVQGGSIIKPLMGPDHDGPTDAAVFRPKLNTWRGVGVSCGLNPEMGKWDPYLMAQMAIDEAYRNLLAVGGGLKQVAILDNFCWGDAKDSLELGALVRAAEGCRETALAYKLPFISGKDSFNNTWKSAEGTLTSIPPTLLVSAIGVINDVRHCLTPGFKQANNLIYVVGETDDALGGSLVNRFLAQPDTRLPAFHSDQNMALYKKFLSVLKYYGFISCHDVSEGGVGVAVTEMAFGSQFGVHLQIPDTVSDPLRFLFAETPGRFVVEVPPDKKSELEQSLGVRSVVCVGTVTAKPDIQMDVKGKTVFQKSIRDTKELWKGTLKNL